ncbi:MAG: DUF1987 domain-containing protein [Bacteroidales bacterium]|jgi:hypothetical protein|nr:DUF1987 domain-containing protein [Bacteroidales bacterium]
MDDLLIQPTESTPQVEFKKSGQLSIKGRSLPEDPKKFYGQLFEWAEELTAEDVQIDVKLEYVNTSSTKKIMELLKKVDGNKKIKHLHLNWYYEVDDLDILEFGEIIGRTVKRIKANYIEYEDPVV